MRGVVHVLGGGGHAKEIIATLEAAGWSPVSVWDDDPARIGCWLLGVPILGKIDEVPPGAEAVIAIGLNATRERISKTSAARFVSVVHPSATVHRSVTVGVGTVVFAGAVIQPDCRIGVHAIINSGAIVAHDCVIADFAHIAPGAQLGGGVRVGHGAFLGIGVSIKPGICVGARAVVGAGSVVIRPVPPDAIVAGCPARTLVSSGKRDA